MEGTKNKTAHDISTRFQSLGAFIEIEPGFDEVSINIYGLVKNFDQVVDLLNEIPFKHQFFTLVSGVF